MARPLIDTTEEDVEFIRQVLSETHEHNRAVKISAKEVATLLTVCTEWLHNEQALQQDREVEFATHHCNACTHRYTPAANESEDCPKCGHNGKG